MLNQDAERFITENNQNQSLEWKRAFACRVMLAVWPRLFRVVAVDLSVKVIERLQSISCRKALAAAVNTHAQINGLPRQSIVKSIKFIDSLDSCYRTCHLAHEAHFGFDTSTKLHSLLEWASISFSVDEFRELLEREAEWTTAALSEARDIFEFAPFLGELSSEGWNTLQTETSNWSFWREWYQGFLDGKPLDWELQRRVALIPEADWEKGVEHIAALIEEIRKDFEAASAEPERHEALEPRSLARVLQSPTISANQIEAAAQDIKDAEFRFLQETGANQLPDEFQMLPGIAGSLSRVARGIRAHASDPSVEDALRQEVGRLNARVLELEDQLQAIKNAKEPVFSKAFKEQLGKSLGDWKMYAAMLGATWVLSGDVEGIQARLENIGALREALFGSADIPAVEANTLPNTTDV